MSTTTEVALHHERSPAVAGLFSLAPRNLDEAFRLADMLADSDLVAKDYKGKPGNCMVAMQWGAEIGLKPMQALQNIAVINGRPSLWGDAMLALVRSSPLCEYVVETIDANGTAICQVKRRGEPEQIRTFSDADAKLAGLIGKQGPWTTNPKRMKQMRARAFALRDVFTDILKGIAMAEEAMDIADPVAIPRIASAVPAQVVLPAVAVWPADKFDEQFVRWDKAVSAGLKSVDDIMALARSKGELTKEQADRINALKGSAPAADSFVDDMEAEEGAT